jgi:hypothetical protein
MKKLLMVSMLCAAMAQGEGIKGTGKSVDVMQFDIRGIKLGMRQEEALKIINEEFPNGEIEETDSEEMMTGLYGKEFTQMVSVKEKNNNNGQFVAIFAPNVLKNKPQELIVGSVGLRLPNNETNLKKLQKSAVAKFGEPVEVNSRGDYYWCDLTDKKECDEANSSLSLNQEEEYIVFGLLYRELEKATFAAARKAEQENKKAEDSSILNRQKEEKIKL